MNSEYGTAESTHTVSSLVRECLLFCFPPSRFTEELSAQAKQIADLQREKARLKQGVLRSTESGAIDHYTPIVSQQAAELDQLRQSVQEL